MLQTSKKIFASNVLNFLRDPDLRVRQSQNFSNEEVVQAYLWGQILIWAKQYATGYENMDDWPIEFKMDKKAILLSKKHNFPKIKNDISMILSEGQEPIGFFKNNTIERLLCSYLKELNLNHTIIGYKYEEKDYEWCIVVSSETLKDFIDKFW